MLTVFHPRILISPAQLVLCASCYVCAMIVQFLFAGEWYFNGCHFCDVSNNCQ